MKLNRRIVCKNGASFSVQANTFAYAEPRIDFAPHYAECEVGYVEGIAVPDYLASYRDGEGSPVFGYVPVEIVERFIAECGGIDLGVMLGNGGFVKGTSL